MWKLDIYYNKIYNRSVIDPSWKRLCSYLNKLSKHTPAKEKFKYYIYKVRI